MLVLRANYNPMQHSFLLLGINYKKADTTKRGRFSLNKDRISDLLKDSKRDDAITGCFCLSTCNRTEIYAYTESVSKLSTLLCKYTVGTEKELSEISFELNGIRAFRHLFRVTSGLESQILGDFEITGQIKSLFALAQGLGSLNPITDRMLNQAIRCSKRIKSETELSTGIASVSYAAVKYILKAHHVTNKTRVVLYGMGKIGSNTCENLIKHLPSPKNNITLVVRSEERLREMKSKYTLPVQTQSKLQDLLKETDILIVATGSEKPLITEGIFPENKTMVIIDLSIPKNVSEGVSSLKNVSYADVDTLSMNIDKSLEIRKKERTRCETIVEEVLSEFTSWISSRSDMEVISKIKHALGNDFQNEIQNIKKQNQSLDEIQAKEIADILIKKVTQRLAIGIKKDPSATDFLKRTFETSLTKKGKYFQSQKSDISCLQN